MLLLKSQDLEFTPVGAYLKVLKVGGKFLGVKLFFIVQLRLFNFSFDIMSLVLSVLFCLFFSLSFVKFTHIIGKHTLDNEVQICSIMSLLIRLKIYLTIKDKS